MFIVRTTHCTVFIAQKSCYILDLDALDKYVEMTRFHLMTAAELACESEFDLECGI